MSETKVLFTVTEDEKLVQMVSKFPCIYDATSLLYRAHSLKENAWKEIAEYVERSVEDCKKRWRNIKDTHQKRQKKIAAENVSSVRTKKWRLADMLTFLNQVESKPEALSNAEDIPNPHAQLKDGEQSNQEHSTKNSQNMEYLSSSRPPTKRIRLDDKILALLNSQRIERTSKKIEEVTKREEDDDERIRQEESQTSPSSQNMENISSYSRTPQKNSQENYKMFEFLNSQRLEKETIFKKVVEQIHDDDVDLFFKSIAYSVKKLSPNLINEAKMRTLQMIIDLENHETISYNYAPANLTSPCTYSRSMSPSASNDENKTLTKD